MDKKFKNYTIQKVPIESWIAFKVEIAKKDLIMADVFRNFIEKYGSKNK